MADARVERIEQGMAGLLIGVRTPKAHVLADLRAWQEVAERHVRTPSDACTGCWIIGGPCPDRAAADAALDRLDALWAGESRG